MLKRQVIREDKEFEKEYRLPKFPKNWPSPDHHKCSSRDCKGPNPPQSVKGTYKCLHCSTGIYVVTVAQAAKIHDQAQRAFQWHEEKRKELAWKRREGERIDEERAIAKYLAEDEEMWQKALKLKKQDEEKKRLADMKAAELRAQEEEKRRLAERKAAELRAQEEERRRLAETKAAELRAQEEWKRLEKIREVERQWRNARQDKRDGVLKKAQIRTVVVNEPKVAKVERRANIKSTVVHVETVDAGSVSSASAYSQPSYVSHKHTKPLPPTPVPSVPSHHQRRPLTPDSSHTVSSQESYRRPRIRDRWATKAPSPESSNPSSDPKRRNTATTTASQISAANYYASQAAAQYPPFPRAGVPSNPTGARYYH
ncbi:hypothetical protein VKT23_006724 [Stygiomarasmius scandens]|uniref:Uncharacterized protein n=1 Tax=Marasmiellus scandens TaxID=2682957 RepID=A0ABR1IMY5_9AGAR